MKVPTNWWLLLLMVALIHAEVTESDDETTVSSNNSQSQSQSTAENANQSQAQTEDQSQSQNQEGAEREQETARVNNNGDNAGARVEADVIDVEAANGKAKTGQTTRIYTTGDVDDNFWLKHLGEDFKHAIHLQVGGTNDDYNQLINQTNNGVHEVVHHEYLPGAERPPGVPEQGARGGNQPSYNQRPYLAAQLSLDNEAMSLKQHYLQHQQQQKQQQRVSHYSPHTYTQPTHQHQPTQQHQHQHTHQHQFPYPQRAYPNANTQILRNEPPNRLHYPPSQRSIPSAPTSQTVINSSEDTLHTGATSPQGTSAGSSSSPSRSTNADANGDSYGDQLLPFKSPFNDYGSRPTRDLTYLLYRRGL